MLKPTKLLKQQVVRKDQEQEEQEDRGFSPRSS